MEMRCEEFDLISGNVGTETYSTGLEDLTIDEDESGGSDWDGDGYGEGEGDGEGVGDGNGEGDDDNGYEEDLEYTDEGVVESNYLEDGIAINGMVDILNIDMKNITIDDVVRFEFADLEVAYLFYNWYARINGFSVRKSHVVRNKEGEKLQQTFVCSREGFREDRGLTMDIRRREPKHETRCGCEAKFRVHIDIRSGRWYVTVFSFDHNHELLEGNLCALLPGHRKMSTTDILQIENFLKVGISAAHMHGAFANNSGGYDRIGFVRKDIYNQIGKQKRQQSSDASSALKYLRDLRLKDPMIFVRHTVDHDGRLEHLFWCDGESQMNYQLFGDVLAFDATYRKNKYLCPVVLFSGVNHHNQTIVFAIALVTNETEETYVWLLEQFLNVMKGKAPSSVITDGDVAMKNAIRRVFPYSHHRLCAWHLLRNAITNVKIPDFIPQLRECMLGDLEVVEFEQKWGEMVAKFGLEENTWINEMYERRSMWATAHIRGNFFAGIRTTSRCEALHSHIKKFVHSRISLTDFVQQFHRCLTYFRFREVEADFHSEYGQAVLQTSLRSLERSASKHFTKEIFLLIRPILLKASLVRVKECQEMAMYSVYVVSKYRRQERTWHVSFCPSIEEFRCSCLRMESVGLPCDHIVSVLVHLDFCELPKCLVLDRWSKYAKDAIRGSFIDGSFYWDSHLTARYATLVQLSKDVSEYAYREEEDYTNFVQILTGELSRLKIKYGGAASIQQSDSQIETQTQIQTETQTTGDNIQDPIRVRSKGCGTSTNTSWGRNRRVQTCRICGARGHNRRSCPNGRHINETGPSRSDISSGLHGNSGPYEDDDINTEMDDLDEFIASSSRVVDG